MLMTGLIVGTVMVNGTAVNSADMLASAQTAVNGANMHQFATVLELYYSDHGNYPEVSGGQALVSTLETEGYIQNSPLNPSAFSYSATDDGQHYKLSDTK